MQTGARAVPWAAEKVHTLVFCNFLCRLLHSVNTSKVLLLSTDVDRTWELVCKLRTLNFWDDVPQQRHEETHLPSMPWENTEPCLGSTEYLGRLSRHAWVWWSRLSSFLRRSPAIWDAGDWVLFQLPIEHPGHTHESKQSMAQVTSPFHPWRRRGWSFDLVEPCLAHTLGEWTRI